MMKHLQKTLMVLIVFMFWLSVSAQHEVVLFEDFNEMTSGIPPGWNRSESDVLSYYNWAPTVLNGEKCINFNSADKVHTKAVLKTQVFNLPFWEVYLSFDYIKGPYTGEFSVYLSTDGGHTYLDNPLITNLQTSAKWSTVEVNLLDYREFSNLKVVFVGVSSDEYDFVRLDNIKIETVPLCAKPKNLFVSAINQTQAKLNWSLDNSGDMPSSYNIEVKDENGDIILYDPALNTQSTTSTLLTGLMPNTTYNVLLQSNCTETYKGMSAWAELFTFTTLCDAFALPMVNNFAEEEGDIPLCWVKGGTNKESVMLSNSITSEQNSDKSIKMESTEVLDAFIATPPINHAANDMEISFKVNTHKNAHIMIALASDIADVSTYIPIMIDSLPVANEWYEYVINTAEISYGTQTGLQLVFYVPAGKKSTVYIDDVVVTEMPTCVRPIEVEVSVLSESEATISWSNFAGQNAGNYQLKFITEEEEEIVNGKTNPYTINDLLPNTDYVVQVRQICAAGDTSAWSRATGFLTFCTPNTVYPYIESFENSTSLYCWWQKQTKAGSGNGSDFGDNAWQKCDVAYPAPEIVDGDFMIKYQQSKPNTHTLLALPFMEIPADVPYEVRFWMYRDQANDYMPLEGVKVWVNDKLDTVGADKLAYIPRDYTISPAEIEEGWYQYVYPITRTGDLFVMLEGISQSGGTIYIDKVEVRERPTCVPVVRIELDSTTTSTVHYSWEVESGVSNQWIVEYQTSEMQASIKDTIFQTNYTIAGLTPQTTYGCNFSVRSYCDVDNESEEKIWDGYFHTRCLPYPFPFIEDFENEFTRDRHSCWSYPVSYVDNNSIFPMVVSNQTLTNQMNTKGYNVFVTPTLMIDTWIGKRISFDMFGGNGPIEVGILQNPNDLSTMELIDTAIAIPDVKTTYMLDITTEYSGKYIYFKTSTSNNSNSYFDNISVMNIPPCSNVAKVSISDINSSDVVVTFEDDENSSWEIQYGPMPLDEDNASIIAVTAKSYTLSGLSSSTLYEARVRSVCNITDKGNWTMPVAFSTKCSPFEINAGTPFFEGFEVGYIHQGPIEGCIEQESVAGGGKWLANNTETHYNRSPYEGDWNATLYYSNEDYMVRALQLKANTNYQFSCFARQDMSYDGSLSVSIIPNLGSNEGVMVLFKDKNIVNGDYQEFKGNFTVAQSGVYYLRVGGKIGMNPYYLSIDNIKIEEVSCASPLISAVTISSITSSSVDMSWVNPASRFIYKLDTVSIDPSTSNAKVYTDTLTSSHFTIGGLEDNKQYYFYIKSVCSDGEECDWSREGTFTTNCSPYTLPYNENFDQGAPNYVCWKSIGQSDPYFRNDIVRSGDQSILCSGVTLASPELAVNSLVGNQMSMWVYSSTENAKISIGVMKDLSDVSTYELISETDITQKNRWVEVMSYFDILGDSDYADFADAKHIIITVSEDYEIYIDDISIEEISSCPKPISLVVTDVTHESVTINWEPREETSWNVRLIREGLLSIDTIVTAHPLVLNSLIPNSYYDVELRGICAVGDTSGVVANAFHTICSPELELPFVENFNHLKDGEILSCWTNDWVSDLSNENMWKGYVGAMTTSPSYVLKSGYGNNTAWSILETPILDLSTVSEATLMFDLLNANGGEFTVLISKNGGMTFNDTLFYNLTEVTQLTTYEANLNAYCGHKVVIAFYGYNKYDYSKSDPNIRLDNVEVFVPSSCRVPNALDVLSVNSDSICFNIVDTTGGTQWEVAFLLSTENIEDATYITTTDKQFVIKDVIPATQYVAYVRAVCGSENSRWRSSDIITTPCGSVVLPYEQNFNTASKPTDLLCVDYITTLTADAAGAPPASIINDGGGFDGTSFMEVVPSMTDPLLIVLPQTEVDVDTISLNFVYNTNGIGDESSTVEVGIIPASLIGKDYIPVGTLDKVNDWTSATVEIAHSGIYDNDYRVVIRISEGGYNRVLLDNIKMNYREKCLPPAGIIINEIVLDTVRFTIKDELNTTWDIAYGLLSESFSNLTVISNITDPNVELKDLQLSSQYQIYLRGMCDGQATDWSLFDTFTTECIKYPISSTNSYVENFQLYEEGTEVPTCWTAIQQYRNTWEGTFPIVANINGDNRYVLYGENTVAMPCMEVPISSLYMDVDIIGMDNSRETEVYIGYTKDLSDVDAAIMVYRMPASTNSVRYTVDLTVFPDDAEYLVFRTLESKSAIDNLELYFAPKCYTPSKYAATVTNITSTTADVSFIVAENHSSMQVSLYENNVMLESNWHSGERISFTGLTPSTDYAIVYRSACEDIEGQKDTMEWAEDTIHFSTHQVPATLPYVCNFEDAAENAQWHVHQALGCNEWIISSKDTLAMRQGESALYITNNDSINGYTFTTESASWACRTFELEAGVYSLSFFYKTVGDNADYLRAFVVPSDIELQTSLSEALRLIPADGGAILRDQSTWKESTANIAIPFDGYYDIAFYWQNDVYGGQNRPAAIDSVRFYKYECAPLVDIQIGNVSATTATVYLNDYSESSQSYEVVVNNGEELSAEDISDAVKYTNDTIFMTGLDQMTSYTLYARAICSDEDTSSWSAPINFTTTCLPDTVKMGQMFTEGFENYLDKDIIGGCWTTNINRWIANVIETSRNRTPRNGSVNATLEYGNTDQMKRSLWMEGKRDHTVSLWARQDGSDPSSSTITISFRDVNGKIVRVAHSNIINGEYQEVSGIFAPEETGVYELIIEGYLHRSNYYLSLDDISVVRNTCSAPYNIDVKDVSTNAATITWETESETTHIVVSGGSYNFDTIFENKAGEQLQTMYLTNIIPATKYQVTALNHCGTHESLPVTEYFVTECATSILPHISDFEMYSNGDLPICWDNSVGTVNAKDRWKIYEIGSNKTMRFNSHTTPKFSTGDLKVVDMYIDKATYALTFDYLNPNGGPMYAFLSNDGGATYTDTILNGKTGITEWTTVIADLAHYNGQTLTVVFHSISNSATGDAYHYIDNLKVSEYAGEVERYAEVCAGNPYVGYGFTIPASKTALPGVYRYQQMKYAVDETEKDTNVILNLIVNEVYETVLYDYFCEGEVYSLGLFQDIRKEGTYVASLQSSAGCDSLVILCLKTINLDVTLDVVICEGDSYTIGDKAYNVTGEYTHTEKVGNCDSVTTLNLTVIPKYYESQMEICEGDSYTWENQTYTQSGRYEKTFINANGCDSVSVLNLTVHPKDFPIDTTICEGQSIYFDGKMVGKSGEYTKAYVNALGCDSVSILTLTVAPRDTIEIDDQVCEGTAYWNYGFKGITITQDTILYQLEKDIDGCESVNKVYVDFVETIEVEITEHIEEGESYTFGGNTYTTSTNVSHTFTSEVTECDSIVHLTLIVGVVSVDIIDSYDMVIAPNPVRGGAVYAVSGTELHGVVDVAILDATGRVLSTTHIDVEENRTNSNQLILRAPEVSGIYYIRINSENDNVWFGKLIVK